MNLEDTCSDDEEFGTISHLNNWCPTTETPCGTPSICRPCFHHPNLALSMRIPVQKSRDTTWLHSLHSLHSSPETSETLGKTGKRPRENAKGHQWHRGICSLIYHEAQDEEQDDDLGRGTGMVLGSP